MSTRRPASRCSKYAARASSTKAAMRTASPTRTTGSIRENAITITAGIAEALVRIAPGERDSIVANRDRFLCRAQATARALDRALAPFAGAKFIAYHNSWPYFARRFRLDVIAFIEPKPGVAPSPAHLAQLISAGTQGAGARDPARALRAGGCIALLARTSSAFRWSRWRHRSAACREPTTIWRCSTYNVATLAKALARAAMTRERRAGVARRFRSRRRSCSC